MNNKCILCPQFFDWHSIWEKQWTQNTRIIRCMTSTDIVKWRERNNYEHFEKGCVGGGGREKGEEETKSMPHAPVMPTSYICMWSLTTNKFTEIPLIFRKSDKLHHAVYRGQLCNFSWSIPHHSTRARFFLQGGVRLFLSWTWKIIFFQIIYKFLSKTIDHICKPYFTCTHVLKSLQSAGWVMVVFKAFVISAIATTTRKNLDSYMNLEVTGDVPDFWTRFCFVWLNLYNLDGQWLKLICVKS